MSSEENAGTTFTFTLPYPIGKTSLLSDELKVVVDFGELHKCKVLVAEDVELNQFLAKHILESWGIIVDIANNGKEAVESVKLKNYDLILMDIQMPEMDGIVATQEIRKIEDPQKSAIPIIALTANALKGDDQRYLNAGMNDYITKPYTEERLYKVISKFLKSDTSKHESVEVRNEKTEIPVAEESLYDLTMVNIIGKNSPTFVRTMIKLFLETIPVDIQKLKLAAESGERDKIGFTAHKMKSTIDSMGITSITATIRKLELKGEHQETDESIRSMIDEVNSVLQKVIQKMKADFTDL